MKLRTLRDLVKVVFDKVPELKSVTISEQFTEYNDETQEMPQTSVAWEGVPDPVLDGIPEVRRIEREVRYSPPVHCIDAGYDGQWEGFITFTRGNIRIELNDVDDYHDNANYTEVIDFNTLAVQSIDASALLEAEERKIEAFAQYGDVELDDLGKKSLFLEAA